MRSIQNALSILLSLFQRWKKIKLHCIFQKQRYIRFAYLDKKYRMFEKERERQRRKKNVHSISISEAYTINGCACCSQAMNTKKVLHSNVNANCGVIQFRFSIWVCLWKFNFLQAWDAFLIKMWNIDRFSVCVCLYFYQRRISILVYFYKLPTQQYDDEIHEPHI